MSTLRSQLFSTAGAFTFDVPSNVSLVFVSMIGGGGGGMGSNKNTQEHGGAGSAEYAFRLPCPVTPGGTVAVTVGAAGLGSAGTLTGGAGGLSSFGSFVTQGALAYLKSDGVAGTGGGLGAVIPANFYFGPGERGAYELGGFTAGSSGGGTSGSTPVNTGGPCINFPGKVISNGGQMGGPGGSSPYGFGGQGGIAGHGSGGGGGGAGAGGGGSGGGTGPLSNGGNGGVGQVLVQWIA